MCALEAEGIVLDGTERRVDVYGVALGPDAKRRMALLIDELRANGVACDMAYGDRGLKGAMKGADRAGARLALVLGDQELADGNVSVKNMADQSQQPVPLDEVVTAVRAALSR